MNILLKKWIFPVLLLVVFSFSACSNLYTCYEDQEVVVSYPLPVSDSGHFYFLKSDNSISEVSSLYGKVTKGACKSLKNGYNLVWNEKTSCLMHVSNKGKVCSRIFTGGDSAYYNQEYILVQTSSFYENKGFEFVLYKIEYSKVSDGLHLDKICVDYADCFVSDKVFFSDGVCIAGGTQDNSTHNIYKITENGIHKCFTASKNSDFLRLVKNPQNENNIIAFLSPGEINVTDAKIFSFDVNSLSSESDAIVDLSADTKLPSGFECFFGFGFNFENDILIPSCVNNDISFVCYSPEQKKIVSVIPDGIGCIVPLCNVNNKFYYIAKDNVKDPALFDIYYGIAAFDGTRVEKIAEFPN